MDIVTILQNVPNTIGYVIVAYILGKSLLAIARVIADAVAGRVNAKTRIIELEAEAKTAEANAKTKAIEVEAQSRVEIARLDAEARTKIAEAELEKAKTQSVVQKEAFEDKSKLASELETYRAQTDVMRQATAASLEATTQAQLETVKILARLASGQKGTDALIKSSVKRITDSGTENKENLSAAIREVMKAIVKLAGDQTIAMTAIQEFLQELSDKLDDPSASEVVIADIKDAAVDTLMGAIAPVANAATEADKEVSQP